MAAVVQPTLAQVCDQVRAHLGDSVNIDTYTDAFLTAWVNEAYRFVQKTVSGKQLDHTKKLSNQFVAVGQTTLVRGTSLTVTTGFVGSGLNDVIWTIGAAPTTPRLYWVRALSQSVGNDKYHAGYDATITATAVDMNTPTVLDASVTVSWPAPYTLHTTPDLTYKAYNGIPSDLIRPIELYGRPFPITGASWTPSDAPVEYSPMGHITDGVLPVTTAATLKWWQWENDILSFTAATAIADVKMKYVRSLPDIPSTSSASDLLLIPSCTDAVALLTASYATTPLGQIEVAKAFFDRAMQHLGVYLTAEETARSANTARVGGQ